MTDHSYLEKCEKLLKEFEITQAQMLRLDLDQARADFMIQMKQMRDLFKQITIKLEAYAFNSEKHKILLTKQIKRLLIFIKEMDLHISGFEAQNLPDENEIIFIFERQHLFKNIYRKHLSDFSAIMF